MRIPALFLLVLVILQAINTSHGFVSKTSSHPPIFPAPSYGSSSPPSTQLSMSLKPAALPLLDAGKALARSGELLIDATASLDVYGGGLSAVGANVRNAGDCVAQAAASCRFKTASELVCDELREGATCLKEATGKMRLAVEEARADENTELANQIDVAVAPLDASSTFLEAAGAGIMQRKPVSEIGAHLVSCGTSLEELSARIRGIGTNVREADESGQRMAFCAEKITEAGNNLVGTKPNKPKGKAWLKG